MKVNQKVLVRGGTLVLGQVVIRGDLLIQGERILAVGELPAISPDVIIEAENMLVLPGAIDTHVHFNDVFMGTISVHDYYTGTLAAAYGGVTSLIDFSNQVPGKSLMSTLEQKHGEADGLPLVDWGVHPVITQPTQETISEIPALIEAGAPTIKCYMTYQDEGLMLGIDELLLVSEKLKNIGGMLLVHAENNVILQEALSSTLGAGLVEPIYHLKSRPKEAENKAIRDCVQIARKTGGRIFIVHMSSADGIDIVAQARAEGLDVIAETCTHYLVFTDQWLMRDDGLKWICSPPIRDRKNQDQLWISLQDKRVSMVTSDDAAYMWEAKLFGAHRFDLCPNGLPGIEPRFNILYSEGVAKNRLSLSRFVELVSSTPAKLFGLWPKKGNLFPGADADVIIFNPNRNWVMGQETLHMATDYSSYENIPITGKIEKVLSRGEIIIDGDKCLAEKGRGQYLHRVLDLTIPASI
ncbi:MAG: dihydropyrimidinase [Anaerolineales bacterium]|jgi:dihydropyrimidinase